MPLHQIYHPPGLFTPQDKQALVDSITSIYTNVGLPAFLVVVVFQPVVATENDDAVTMYTGGVPQPRTNFVRIVVWHIARKVDTSQPAVLQKFMETYEAKIAPWVAAKGVDWEVSIGSTPVEAWRINGVWPPVADNAEDKKALKRWTDANKVVVA